MYIGILGAIAMENVLGGDRESTISASKSAIETYVNINDFGFQVVE
jgi:hypothetical protein